MFNLLFFLGLSLLRCIPLDQKSLKPISKSIKEESHKTLLVPLQKSTGKEIKRWASIFITFASLICLCFLQSETLLIHSLQN